MNNRINLGHAIFTKFDEHHYEIVTSLFSFFFAGYIFGQKEKLKTKSAEIKCFSRFSIARIKPQFKKVHQMVQVHSQKYRRMFKAFYFRI
jgi:hypothetical protein